MSDKEKHLNANYGELAVEPKIHVFSNDYKIATHFAFHKSRQEKV